MSNFKIEKFLNDSDSPSTASVVTYCGKSPWKRLKGDYLYFELADCSNKVRLHMSDLDTEKDFIRKLERLEGVLSDYIKYLKLRQK